MEGALIVLVLLVVGLVAWITVSTYTNSVDSSHYRRKFRHQEEELRKAAMINAKLRIERDAYMELALKYKRLANNATPTQFTKEQLTVLIQLCHPDKHGGRDSANRMTQLLNDMRSRAK